LIDVYSVPMEAPERRHGHGPNAPVLPNEIYNAPSAIALLYVAHRKRRRFHDSTRRRARLGRARATALIRLVGSYLASMLAGRIAPVPVAKTAPERNKLQRGGLNGSMGVYWQKPGDPNSNSA